MEKKAGKKQNIKKTVRNETHRIMTIVILEMSDGLAQQQHHQQKRKKKKRQTNKKFFCVNVGTRCTASIEFIFECRPKLVAYSLTILIFEIITMGPTLKRSFYRFCSSIRCSFFTFLLYLDGKRVFFA